VPNPCGRPHTENHTTAWIPRSFEALGYRRHLHQPPDRLRGSPNGDSLIERGWNKNVALAFRFVPDVRKRPRSHAPTRRSAVVASRSRS